MVEVCAIANRTVGSGETPFSVEIVLSVSLYVDFIGILLLYYNNN